MTQQQIQYAYWQQMRQQQLYRAYAAGCAAEKVKKNSYDTLAKVTDDCFLNYLEYSPANIDPQNAVRYLKSVEVPMTTGRCTGVYDKVSGKALRQLDWYYNNEVEFIVKMKSNPTKGIYGSIGVTAASPKMTKDIAEHYITTHQYYEYFDVLPFFTVDGVNEKGIFAQSNVVNKNGVEININDGVSGKEDCCVVMLVRYILDHFDENDLISSASVRNKLLSNLHIYGTTKLGGYNPHILVACHNIQKSYVIEFTATDVVVNEFPIMTNFRTFKYGDSGETPLSSEPIPTLNEFKTLGLNNWKYVEKYGIGLDRWDIASEFLSSSNENTATTEDFKKLRAKLNYTHAYDKYIDIGENYKNYWYTDNLSGNLTVWDMKGLKAGEPTMKSQEIIDVLNEYRRQFEHRARLSGEGLYTNTWHTTHGAIYDLINLSCNIQSQQNTSWNILPDGSIENITEDRSETKNGKWVLLAENGSEVMTFDVYEKLQQNVIEWKNSNQVECKLSYSPIAVGIQIPVWQLHYDGYSIDDTDERLHDIQMKNLNVVKTGTTEHYALRWIDC